MGKKKGKKQDENWGDETTADDILTSGAEPVTVPVAKGGGGKKGKKKKQLLQDEDDIDAELLAIANETDGTIDKATPPDHTPSEEPVPAVKGGKKGKKKKQQNEEDDIDAELLAIANETDGTIDKITPLDHTPSEEPVTTEKVEPVTAPVVKGGKKGKKKKQLLQDEDDIDAELLAIANETDGTIDKATPPDHTPSEEPVPVVKGGKKGKKKKQLNEEDDIILPVVTSTEKPPATSEPYLATSEPSLATSEPPLATSEPPLVTNKQPLVPGDGTTVEVTGATSIDNGEEGGEGEGEGGGGGEDKKKKKKKKKTEKEPTDKKTATKVKKGKTAVQKMKEEIEALRQAQKKREEEELAKQRAAEEAERQRLEELRLEKERKEKKKQKEKEKRERLKKEGKLLSKAEKERRTRANLHLQALVAQGIIVPQKSDGSEARRGPVRYGSKVKKNKPQESTAGLLEEEDDHESNIDEGISSISEVASNITEEDNVKDNWYDEEEETEDIKDTWEEDSDDDTNELIPANVTTPTTETTPIKVTTPISEATPTVDSEGEEGESDTSDSDSSDDDTTSTPYDRAMKRIKERRARHYNERSPDLLRSPVVCVLGHVDTGKTKILDKIRHTHVQDGEAGGITQQIGATFVPPDAIQEQTKMIKEFQKTELKVPGLLIIDTPGHESFSNLRTRGSSMCDIAILVVDIMHGLEPQTIESLNLLRNGNVPFVVALNKIDRLYNWVRNPSGGIKDTLKRQKPNTKAEFDERVESVVLQFAEQGVNAALYWDKVDFKEYIALVPTSAHSGDGMGDLISLIVTHSQLYLNESLMFSKEVEAIVLEVKVISGLGTTIDVILRNGILNEGDTLVLAGTEGPIVTQARALLMPQPLRELRVKNAYINHKTIIASQGVKITGKDLEKALAGMQLLVAKKPDEIDVLKEEASATMSSLLNTFKLSERGVFVQASTLGSLEALVEFLKTSKIPYAGVNIGPVHKKDVMKASVMLERDNQWACILAFDVRVEREAQEMADSLGVRIFTADIIYHLFDSFMKYREELKEKRRREHEHIAIFPCKLKVLPNCVFNARNPIIIGVTIIDGVIKSGTPIVVPSKEFVHLGTVSSIEVNHKPVDLARKGSEVCIKIEPTSGEAPKLFGRHFDYDDILMSKITRESIDAVKNYFRDDLQKSDWKLIVELKKIFQVY